MALFSAGVVLIFLRFKGIQNLVLVRNYPLSSSHVTLSCDMFHQKQIAMQWTCIFAHKLHLIHNLKLPVENKSPKLTNRYEYRTSFQ